MNRNDVLQSAGALTLGLAFFGAAEAQTAPPPPLAAASAGLAAPAAAVPASAPPPARGPSLELALEAARVAIDTCTARQQKIGVTVIDSAGVAKVLLASDGVSPRGVQSSTNKAVTALSFKAPTSQLGEQAKTDRPLAEQLAANPSFNGRAGGVLIKVGSDLIGAIGVGGARGSEVDEVCALAGLQKIQSRLF
jgi:uncharacterized protein GlcG (DUF336 family)